MEKKEFQQEEEYFNKVEEIIGSKLKKLRGEKDSLKSQVVSERKGMWEDNRHGFNDFDDVILMSSQDALVDFAEKQYVLNELEIRRLAKMEKSPYFGRLDFIENETGEENTIYIGIYSLMEEESHEIYVVDWRAPISSMFYQFDLGPGWYEVNEYREEVEITAKRQYKIEDGRFLYVYDTDSSMYDDILGEVLSQSSDHKLKVIVGSIQKEQNLAMRSDTKRSCLIYGLAGSGKTSIGLHRLAYVLYHNKDTIKSENILILSNNNIFESYIATILPDLGERPAETKVFADLLETALETDMTVEDYYSQLKAMEGRYAGDRIKWIRIKYSAEILQYCIDYFTSFSFEIPEIRYGDEIMVSSEVIAGRLKMGRFPDFKSRRERLDYLVKKAIEDFFYVHKEEIRNEIEEDSDEIQSAEENNVLYKRKMMTYVTSAQDEIRRLNRLDSREQAVKVLAGFLRQMGEGDEEAERLADSLQRRKLLYEDALFYLLIKVLMGEVAPFSRIYHTVIDESQDYNLIQLYIIKALLPKSSFTLLGDIYQTVNSVTTIQKYEDYGKIFGSGLAQIRLSKCYRSSSDINALAFELINEPEHPITEEYSYFARSVRRPQYIVREDMLSCIVPILEQLEKYKSVAVIVDSDIDGLAVKSYLQEYKEEIQMILSPDDELTGRLVIIPLILAKGLEFDAVILYHCVGSNKENPLLRRKVYLGCTRALHELYFIERDMLPDSLQGCKVYMDFE